MEFVEERSALIEQLHVTYETLGLTQSQLEAECTTKKLVLAELVGYLREMLLQASQDLRAREHKVTESARALTGTPPVVGTAAFKFWLYLCEWVVRQ